MVIQRKKNQWVVSDEFNNQRIDYWLKKNFSFITYPSLCKLIRKGTVRVNGKRIKNSSTIFSGDLINLSRPIQETPHSKNKEEYNRKFSKFINGLVIYKDDFSILLNKPNGLAVQGGTKIKLNIDIMLDSLKFNLNERPRLVHRIDKQTSGLLIIARTLQSSKHIGNLFKRRLIDKVYLAIVYGCPKYKKAKIMLSEGEKKQIESLTFFKVLNSKNNISFLVIKPITGRKHQIRNHLNYIGNQIIGETKFKNDNPTIKPTTKYLHLHAFSLRFVDQNGEEKYFSAPLPEHFKNTIERYGFKEYLSKQDLEFIDIDNYKLIC